jgi:RHS repeat-associated protein
MIRKTCRRVGKCVGRAWAYPYLGRSKKMGCLKLPYYEKEDRPNFLGLWKKSERSKSCDNYYPFGAVSQSYSRENSVPNKRLYQGKEYQDDLSLNIYDSEWRQYDPWGVFTTTMDPHAEKYFSISPYSWSAGNPVKFIDPDGRDYYLNLYSGRVEHLEGSKDQFDRAYVHLTGDGASVGEIQDALNSRGYNYAVNGNVPGGYAVDTKAAYKGWIMMQTFSEENVGAIMFMAGNAWSSGLPTSKAAGRAVSIWGLANRGLLIEKALGGNLPYGFQTIDKVANGVATSIKSIDVTAKSYQKNGAILSKLKGYINDLAGFTRGERGGVVVRQGIEFESKAIEVAIQPGKASLSQWEQIGKAMKYAKDQGIEFSLKFFK